LINLKRFEMNRPGGNVNVEHVEDLFMFDFLAV